jgi:hypothetical protein
MPERATVKWRVKRDGAEAGRGTERGTIVPEADSSRAGNWDSISLHAFEELQAFLRTAVGRDR